MSRFRSTILCIDTDLAELSNQRLVLEAQRYEVLTATNERDALRLFSAYFVDAAIVGHTKNIDTERMCGLMKKAKPHIPIMLRSGYGQVSEAALKHVDAFVDQGRPAEVFLASLDRVLNLNSRFFSRWLDNWKFRLSSSRLDGKQKEAA